MLRLLHYVMVFWRHVQVPPVIGKQCRSGTYLCRVFAFQLRGRCPAASSFASVRHHEHHEAAAGHTCCDEAAAVVSCGSCTKVQPRSPQCAARERQRSCSQHHLPNTVHQQDSPARSRALQVILLVDYIAYIHVLVQFLAFAQHMLHPMQVPLQRGYCCGSDQTAQLPLYNVKPHVQLTKTTFQPTGSSHVV